MISAHNEQNHTPTCKFGGPFGPPVVELPWPENREREEEGPSSVTRVRVWLVRDF
jgi:hypothetical protein